MPTVVVTGAAGSLGTRVAALLAARPDIERVVGVDVVPCSLSHPKFDPRVIDLAAEPRPGDPDLRSVFEGADAVIHLAWRTPDGPGRDPRAGVATAAVNRRSLRRVLDAASETHPESLVHLSSATVYGAWPDNQVPLTEDARLRPNPEFSFAVSKAEAERILAEWKDQHTEVCVALLRPAVTVGPDGRPLYQALGATRSPSSGDSGLPVQYLHVDDLAQAVTFAWENHLSGVYNVAPDTGIQEEEARALVGGVAKVTLPARVAGRVSALGWGLWRKGVPVEARAYILYPWVIAPDRLKAAGWVPNYSSEEALVASDPRLHWDDLPPGRRQNLNLLVTLMAAAGLLAGAAQLSRRCDAVVAERAQSKSQLVRCPP